MTTDLKCPSCGASIPNFVGLTSKCLYCKSNVRRGLEDSELKILEQEASLGIDLLRQMKELRKEYGETGDREKELTERFCGFYFSYLGHNRKFKKCPSCNHPSYMTSRHCHICGVKFTDDGIHLPLPDLEEIAQEVGMVRRTITLNIVGTNKQCPNCSRMVNTGAKFCPKCGAEFQQETTQKSPPSNKFCPQCGESNLPDAPFCVSCGHKFAR